METSVRSHYDLAAMHVKATVSIVSTAQILQASGNSATEASAFHALSDIMCRYIASLGRATMALAEARGCTEPNVADLVLALEDHILGGFPGASDPACSVLCSGALAELAGFVAAAREVPFAKPLPRRDSSRDKGWESFAMAGMEPPLRHVPRWLPCFPKEWEERRHGHSEVKAKNEDTNEVVMVTVNGNGDLEGKRARAVMEKREKVSFSVGKKRRQHVVAAQLAAMAFPLTPLDFDLEDGSYTSVWQ